MPVDADYFNVLNQWDLDQLTVIWREKIKFIFCIPGPAGTSLRCGDYHAYQLAF
jgi:hypothetical protein